MHPVGFIHSGHIATFVAPREFSCTLLVYTAQHQKLITAEPNVPLFLTFRLKEANVELKSGERVKSLLRSVDGGVGIWPSCCAPQTRAMRHIPASASTAPIRKPAATNATWTKRALARFYLGSAPGLSTQLDPQSSRTAPLRFRIFSTHELTCHAML